MSEVVLVALITALTSGGVMAALVGWLKDRKKDQATAKLTDVEALQKQVVLLTTITDYLRKENATLAVDRDREMERSSRLQTQLRDVQDQLDVVTRNARSTQTQLSEVQAQCEQLKDKLKTIMNGDAR